MEIKKEQFAIFTDNLTRKFGAFTAVKTVNLRIRTGEVYALIGPNGAGKTTLIKMLVGLLSPTKGTAYIFGNNIVSQPIEAKKNIGYISDNPTAYDYLTGYEFLALTGKLRNLPAAEIDIKIKNLAKLFPIEKILSLKMKNYSRGNRQKVAFLASLMSNPKLLLIDEPIAGLDPDSIKIFGQQIKKFANNGGSVLFSTHILSFGDLYATRVGVMDEGRIVREDNVTSKKTLYKIYQASSKKEN